MQIMGIILAGGMGRRMGGRDKGLVKFKNKPLIAHVLERLAPQVGNILISANRELETYLQFGYPVISDVIPGFAGPLAGLQAGMKNSELPFVATVPCDAPFLPLDLTSRLMKALDSEHADVAVAQIGGRLEPVFTLCKTSVVSNLSAFLESGGHKMDTWLRGLDLVAVPFDDQPQAFTNINTLAELGELEAAK